MDPPRIAPCCTDYKLQGTDNCIIRSAKADSTVRILQVSGPHQLGTLPQTRECRSGETPAGGPRLARTPIGTPPQAQPSSTRVGASPAPVPYTAAKAWAPAPTLGSRSEARTGRQLARTPVGLPSAYNPALHLADPQDTPGGLQQARPHAVLLCKQKHTRCIAERLEMKCLTFAEICCNRG